MENINIETVEVLDTKLDFLKREEDEKLKEVEREIEILKNNIKTAERYMNKNYADLRITMKTLEKLEQTEDISFADEIKHIMEHPLVISVDVDSTERKLIVETKNIIIQDEDGNKYLGNKFKIVFNFERYNVRFYGLDEDLHRKSYWTNHDPHPHIDGSTGVACLGDAGSMLSISMNEKELYASYIIALNFLQQVNTEDVAGKNIGNWDCIDDEGNIIDNPHHKTYTCSCCGETIEDGDQFECSDCGDIICVDCYRYNAEGYRVCESCIDENYTYCDYCGEYHKNEDVYETNNDEHICKYCVDDKDNWKVCDECGRAFDSSNTSYVMTPLGEYICDDCEHKYTVCDDCGKAYKDGVEEVFDEDEQEWTNLCPDCIKKYPHIREEVADAQIPTSETRQDVEPTNPCARCGKHVEEDEEYIDENGAMICKDCYEELYVY